MLLILSARIVNEDISLHYGRLPPSFLPLGNRRLFSWQADLANGGAVAMTVPENYEISDIDMAEIKAAGIRLLPQPSSYSLTDAIRAAVATLKPDGPLRLLYGDTLVRGTDDAPDGTDRVAVQGTSSNYPWAYVVDDNDGGTEFSDTPPRQLGARRVVCGDYTFADPDLLVKACDGQGIIEALNTYHQTRPLELVQAEDWFDFGHLPLYFQSKKQVMIKRVFNQLAYENHLLIKQSADTHKIRAEAHWYESLPGELHIHTPRYRGRVERNHQAGYAIEYLYHPLLSDLAGFGALPLPSWLEIMGACFEFAEKCHAIRPDDGAPEAAPAFASAFFDTMIAGKTWERLEAYSTASGMSLDEPFTLNGTEIDSVRSVVEGVIAKIPATTQDDIRFWHGDMFFGNMFYDFTARRILAIDPRGQMAAGQYCLFGDLRYDLAKLAHSVIGQYDKIILGRASLVENGPRNWDLTLSAQPHQSQIEAIFMKEIQTRYGLDPDVLIAMTALLFFSMLPLHGDRPDLQKQMLANGLRLATLPKGSL
ncbi:MAG: hypothetical protein ACI80I_002702 [Akkermansiaceae bacterium]